MHKARWKFELIKMESMSNTRQNIRKWIHNKEVEELNKNRIGRWEAAFVKHQKCTYFSGFKGRKFSSRKKSLRELMEKYRNVRMLLIRY
jgi:hypothetical protein